MTTIDNIKNRMDNITSWIKSLFDFLFETVILWFKNQSYRIKLEKLFRVRAKVEAEYDKQIASAGQSQNDVDAAYSGKAFELRMVDEEIATLSTNNLLQRAMREFIHIPTYNDSTMWYRCEHISDRYVLTDKGISYLKSEIFSEMKKRRESWIPVLSALTGIIGALVGLVASFKGC